MKKTTSIKPEDITYTTDIVPEFVKDLKKVTNPRLFGKFIQKWKYWLDPETLKLTGKDWKWMKPLIADCRNEKIVPEKKHDPASALLMPERIFNVSIVAHHFKAPWGCAYLRMKQMGDIDY